MYLVQGEAAGGGAAPKQLLADGSYQACHGDSPLLSSDKLGLGIDLPLSRLVSGSPFAFTSSAFFFLFAVKKKRKERKENTSWCPAQPSPVLGEKKRRKASIRSETLT